MEKTVITLLFLFTLTCACLGGQDTSSKASDGRQKAVTKTTVAEAPSSGGVVEKAIDLAAAIASGQSYKCTYTHESAKAETYIKGDKYRSKVSAEGVVVHTISDGQWAYVWNEGSKTGMKYNLENTESQQEDMDAQGYSDLNEVASAAFNVECRPDIISDSVFNPPSDVSFQDMDEKIKQMQEMAEQIQQGGGMPDPCSMCDMIPDDEAKNECLKDCG